ncbi:MAG: hypothetical protein AABX01_04700 [Candidatus Micrarchaeota archaeon]
MVKWDFRKANKPILIVSFFVVLAAIIFIAIMAKGYFEMQNDARGAPCDKLPTFISAKIMLEENMNVVFKIEKIGGTIIVEEEKLADGTQRCPGKADFAIYYGTDSQRTQIKALIGDKFYGIPYRMYNT